MDSRSVLRQWNFSYDSRVPYDFPGEKWYVETGGTFQHKEEQGVKMEK